MVPPATKEWPELLRNDKHATPKDDGWRIECIPCSRSKGKSHVLKMKNQFSIRSWQIHCNSEAHIRAVSDFSGDIVPTDKDQNLLTSFGFVAPVKRSFPKPKRKANEIQTTINSDPTATTKTPSKKQKTIPCVGVLSRHNGASTISDLIYLKQYCTLSSDFYTFRSSLSMNQVPVIEHPRCTGIGETEFRCNKAGKLTMCNFCISSRKIKGKYQINSMVSKRLKGFKAALDSENSTQITVDQYNAMKSLRQTKDESLTDEGVEMKETILCGVEYYEELEKLKSAESKMQLNKLDSSSPPSKLPPSSFGPLDKLMTEDSFIKDFVSMYESNPEFRKSIALCFVKGIVKRASAKSQNYYVHEERVIQFSKYMYSVCPEAARILNINLKGPCDRYMKKLHAKETDSCVLWDGDKEKLKSELPQLLKAYMKGKTNSYHVLLLFCCRLQRTILRLNIA